MIVIIGGGIVGTAIAYYLSQAGVKDITLIEKETLLGTAVTQFCSGGVRHQFTTPINCRFSILSMKTIRALAKEIDYKKYGYLILDKETGITGPRVKMQRELGINAEILSVQEIKERFPFINTEGISAGSFFREDGIADPSLLLAYYQQNAKKNGVKFLTNTKVEWLHSENGKVNRITTNQGEIRTDWVILAAGVQSKELAKTVGLDIPIIDRRKYILVIEGFAFDFPLVMEVPTGWYIKKEGSDALMGMSGKDEKLPYQKQEESVQETIEAGVLRIPDMEKKGIRKVLSSLSDETPDKHAIIDQPLPGLIIATGFSGHGFMHSPATGQIVASLVQGEQPAIDIAELKLNRSHIKETIAI